MAAGHAAFSGEGPDGRKLSWASSDPSVAAVDENGRITPIALGETIITCAAVNNPGVTAACGVLVVADGNIYLWNEEEQDAENQDGVLAWPEQ